MSGSCSSIITALNGISVGLNAGILMRENPAHPALTGFVIGISVMIIAHQIIFAPQCPTQSR